MKKRIITLFAILALLVACTVIAAQAEGEYTSAINWNEKCGCGCGSTLANIQWTTWEEGMAWEAGGHYLVTGATFTASPAWGTSNLTILLRSTADSTVDPEPVTMTMAAKAQFNGGSFITKKVSIYGEKATIQSQLANSNGGMFRTATGGTLNIKGDVTLKGTEGNTGAGNNGGLIGAFQGNVNLDGVTMYQVTSKDGGACLYTNTATIKATNCTFIGVEGATTPRGGTVRVVNGNVTLSNCTIQNTKATTGGLAFVAGGSLTMQNCTATGCDASGADNIYMAGGTVYLQGTSITTADNDIRGNGVYVDGGTLRLHQKTNIVGPEGANKLKGNIAVDTSLSGVIEVSTSWTGTASLQTFTASGGVVNITPGKTMSSAKFKVISWDSTAGKWVASTASGNTATTAQLWAENTNALSPRINFYQTFFMPYRATVMDKDNNVVEWTLETHGAITSAAAKNAASGSQGGYYAQMQCDYNISLSKSSTVALSGVLDLNGFNMSTFSAKAGSQLILVDTKTAAGQAGGTVALTAADETKNNVAAADILQDGAHYFDGKLYITNFGDEVATVYPVEYKITNVSLRPSATAASLYYTASVKAHAEAGLQNWGVAVSINPNAGATLADYMYTQTSEVAEDNAYNGVLIKDIAKNGSEKNAEYAAKVIYAKAYLTLADGTVVFSDAADKNLTEIITAVEAQDQSALTEAQKTAIADMQASAWYADIFGAPEA